MSKGKLPYFCWYPADFEVDENVKLMNIEEIGLYAICLNHCWLNGSLPAEPLEIARAMKVPKGQFLRAWPRVSPCFKARDDGRWTNPRQEREREEAKARTDHGRKGAAARWKDGARVMPEHSSGMGRVMPRAYDSDSVSDFEFGSEGSAEGGAAAAFDLEAAWLEFHAVYHPKGRSRQIDARSYYLEKLITAGPLAESRHVEIMRLMLERWVPSDLWDRGFVTREDVFIQQESWTETPEPSARYAAQMSRRAAEDRKAQEFNQAFAAWQVDHPGGTREEYVDWQFEQEWGKEALLEMKAQEAKWDKSQAATA